MNWETQYNLPEGQRIALLNMKTILMMAGFSSIGLYDEAVIEQICLYGVAHPELLDLMTVAANRGPRSLQEMLDIIAELQSHHPAVMTGAL